MDHAIGQLKDYMKSTMDMYKDMGMTIGDIKKEVTAYVEAINTLERYYYGKEETTLNDVLFYY